MASQIAEANEARHRLFLEDEAAKSFNLRSLVDGFGKNNKLVCFGPNRRQIDQSDRKTTHERKRDDGSIGHVTKPKPMWLIFHKIAIGSRPKSSF